MSHFSRPTPELMNAYTENYVLEQKNEELLKTLTLIAYGDGVERGGVEYAEWVLELSRSVLKKMVP